MAKARIVTGLCGDQIDQSEETLAPRPHPRLTLGWGTARAANCIFASTVIRAKGVSTSCANPQIQFPSAAAFLVAGDEVFGGEAVTDSVLRNGGFAFFGFRAGGEFRVRLVSVDLRLRSHEGSFQ